VPEPRAGIWAYPQAGGEGEGPGSDGSSHLLVTVLQPCSKLRVQAGAKLPGRFLALCALPLGAAHVK